MTADPFGTATLRERVLAGWTAAPVRFREDANAEEELVLGGYRDRVVVELAQNAADAALRAGVPGRLLLRVDEVDGQAVLLAANTGAALDAAGVQALATLRASAKRDHGPGPGAGTVGRFGVGFSAVLAVTDEPVVVSRHGGVRFSAADTRDLLAVAASGAPGLAEELARRDGHVPALRLPFPAEGSPPEGYDTAVLLPLRDAVAQELVLRLLDEVDDPLLLALPGLAEVTVVAPGSPPRTIIDVASRWEVLRAEGELDAEVLAGRPTEERTRRAWSVTWALPRAGGPPGVVHAPTPSDEPLPWPALLVATFPLDSSRRHVAPGPVTEEIVRQAASAYARLLARCAAGGREIWPLVPVGLAVSALDEALRTQLLRLLPGTPLLPDPAVVADAADTADTGAHLIRPRDAVALEPPAGADPQVVAVLARRLAGLVVAPRSASAALRALEVRTIGLADAVEQLPAADDPAGCRQLYAGLAVLAEDPLAREALAALPVPLADGRTVRGIRGLLLPAGPSQVGAALGALGLRTVHPEAAHPLLERLGAVTVDARAALDLPAVGELVAAWTDADAEDEPAQVDAVLELVAAAVAAGTLSPGELSWLADLWLADESGEPVPAGALALPGSPAARLFDPDEVGVVAPALLDRWGPAVLAAAGVLPGPALLHREDVPLDPDADLDDPAGLATDLDILGLPRLPGLPAAGPGGAAGAGAGRQDPRDLDGWEDWADTALDALPFEPLEASVVELDAVLDLDLVRDAAWPLLLDTLAADPRLRSALVTPARIRALGSSDDGRALSAAVGVPSYTAWWLARRLAGGRSWADPDAEPGLAALLPPAPPLLAALEPDLRRALGAVASPADLDARAVQALVDGLSDPDTVLDPATVLAVWTDLAGLADTAGEIEPPSWVRVLDDDGTLVVPADQAVVVDEPALLQRRDLGLPVLAGSPEDGIALARLLDLPLAADLAAGQIDEEREPGVAAPVPQAALALAPAAPASWCEHDVLLVDGVEVQWWVEPAATGAGPARVHACTVEGLAAGLAWAGSVWARRAALAEVLADPDALPRLLAEEAFTPGAAARLRR
ncbi:MAG TPA: hypothetical protein VFP72_10030 [Kineosporiaceae bacterium]|nr:hypothetical protein [Kineosporiaceae bacterium]